jgi:hypothetical protein
MRLEGMARPERLELPTYWFVAIEPRRINVGAYKG